MPDILYELGVSRETEEKLRDLENQIATWSKSINLIARSTVNELWNRHILDSAQLFRFAPENASLWLDLGSGGGLPGLVVSLLSQDLRPGLAVELVESDQRKAAFLKLMAARFELRTTITKDRIERLAPRQASVVSARAFSPLDNLVGFAKTHLNRNGLAIFPKGRNHDQEMAQARQSWTFACTAEPSILDPESKILLISDIQAAKGPA